MNNADQLAISSLYTIVSAFSMEQLYVLFSLPLTPVDLPGEREPRHRFNLKRALRTCLPDEDPEDRLDDIEWLLQLCEQAGVYQPIGENPNGVLGTVWEVNLTLLGFLKMEHHLHLRARALTVEHRDFARQRIAV